MIDRVFRMGSIIAGLIAGTIALIARRLPPTSGTDAEMETQRQTKTNSRQSLVKIIKLFAVFMALMLVGGFLVAASGIIPIKASSRHWKITEWFLHFSKKRSVATHSLGIKAPPLDNLGLVLKGAGHYEIGCNPCHGSPQFQTPRIPFNLTPNPPYLPRTIKEWKSEELFYIVKHGIKFTGMPAWPAPNRDDEVWAVVAFLRKFPELNASEYKRLVNGETVANGEVASMQELTEAEKPVRTAIESCARCHGVDGLGRGEGAHPKLAGQRTDYFVRSLQAYTSGQRQSGIMMPIAAGLSQEEIHLLARYYTSLSGAKGFSAQDAAAIERGKVIAQQGLPAQRVPACVSCHGPGDHPRNPVYPELAGQHADYIVLQLEILKSGIRGGTDFAHIMRRVAAGLTNDQMRDASAYYASLPSRD